MPDTAILFNPKRFSESLYEIMAYINPGITELAPYEFCYALDNVTPDLGWASVALDEKNKIEYLIKQKTYYANIHLKPIRNNQIVLDEEIIQLTRMLFTGLVAGFYLVDWVKKLFYFDIRGFYFLVRTNYYSQAIKNHFGGKPRVQFEPTQECFEKHQDIGYKEFKEANKKIDLVFISTIQKLITIKGTPILFTLAGPSAAGKTEIVDRLRYTLEQDGKSITTIEMDNFFKDGAFRDERELNKEVIHFELFKQSMQEILCGHKISIPRYDFIHTTSSHDFESRLKPGGVPLEVEPADIIFLEGNFPFHLKEFAHLISLKIVYLTDDPIRLKRKWKRDIDYRKKYDPNYFCNRYFRTQFFRAEEVYRPLMEVSDMIVDTSAAALYITPELSTLLHIPLNN